MAVGIWGELLRAKKAAPFPERRIIENPTLCKGGNRQADYAPAAMRVNAKAGCAGPMVLTQKESPLAPVVVVDFNAQSVTQEIKVAHDCL